MVTQQVLTERSDSIYAAAKDCIENIINHPEWKGFGSSGLKAAFHLEAAHFHTTFYDVAKAREHAEAAKDILGLSVSETGALGKRTRFQEKELAQLTLKISQGNEPEAAKEKASDNGADLPTDLKLNDEVRLERISFAEKEMNGEVDLSPLEQAVILVHPQQTPQLNHAFLTKFRYRPFTA